MADMRNLKPQLTPLLAFSKERWAQLRAEMPSMPVTERNRRVQDEWKDMTEEERAVYVKKVSVP